MIDYRIDWNVFKVKFGGREQTEFERLSYVLFCKEYGQKFGIFRYKNQAGIETNPINIEEKLIGFQSKFYDTKISDNIADIKDSLKKAKNKNQGLNTILFYFNKELSESSNETQQKPRYQTDIENYAADLGIKLIWKVPSHFEIQLLNPENHWLYEIFFSINKGLLDFIGEIEKHSNEIFNHIKTEINWDSKTIKLDRTEYIQKIRNSFNSNQSIVLCGVGGCGKTALIKDLFKELACPFFTFKAREFSNLRNINDLFASYGNYKLSDLLDVFKDENLKIIIIDSAENIADIEDTDIFYDFISNLSKNNWKIIFTTRDSYFNDLTFRLANTYKIIFSSIRLNNISEEQLNNFSEQFNFSIPDNYKFRELLLNPFYLSEYLRQYSGQMHELNEFKSNLWNDQILKLSYRKDNLPARRERTFLQVVTQRVKQNSFWVTLNNPDDEALYALSKDEIVQYDVKQNAWFIAHDIYEEWALDKYINLKYIGSEISIQFIESLGSYLPVRRAFRKWLSDKLEENNSEIKKLINDLLNNEKLEYFWKDEILVSILLSDYSETFFKLFKTELLQNNQEFLIRVIFILRIACKELDTGLMKLLALKMQDWTKLKYIFTIPKGSGWNNIIKFIFENLDSINLKYINHILSLLSDWTFKNTAGKTTQYAGKISLYFYEKLEKYDDREKKLISIITKSSSEIKEELGKILDSVTSNRSNKYYQLANEILTKPLESIEVVNCFPEKIFEVAEKLWFVEKQDEYPYGHHDVEYEFGLQNMHEYRPASAFQTPIIFLLRNKPIKTIDFIISFVNKTTDNYANSDLDYKEKIQVCYGEDFTEQLASERLWQTYRGTHVSPNILESIHMALENWLLEIIDVIPQENLELILIKLLKESNSVSISAIVASIVCAYPDKLYNIAKILFQTKEFFKLDLHRKIKDSQHFELYSPYDEELLVNERKKSNKLKHREKSLEDIALYYQAFEIPNPIVDVETRQKELGGIWDKYYSDLPTIKNQSEDDKDFRFTLNRIDFRKMKVKREPVGNNQILLHFETDLAPDLKEISESHNKKLSEDYKYINLNMWANKRFNNEDTKDNKYENSPKLVFEESKEIFENLGQSENFQLLYHSTPAYAFAVLLRDYNEYLSQEEKIYCKNVLLQFASLPLYEGYFYQISDGTEPSIISLKDIIKIFPDQTETIKLLLLQILFKDYETKKYAINCILNIWDDDFEIAQHIFLVYLTYKPEYDLLQNRIWSLRYTDSEKKIKKEYESFNKKLLGIKWNKISYDKTKNIDEISYGTLNTAFLLLPNGSIETIHTDFIMKCISRFSDLIFDEERERKSNLISIIYSFLAKLAYFCLNLPKDKIAQYLEPFINKFNSEDYTAHMFLEFAVAQDQLKENEKFWYVWQLFYSKIVDLISAEKQYFKNQEIIITYLLAHRIIGYGKVTEWHTLKQENTNFYFQIAKDIGANEHVLYSISKIFNDIAFDYLEEGFNVISYCIENYDYSSKEVNSNTIYYIENITRRFILSNEKTIKTDNQVRNKVLKILDFLIGQDSVFAYMLRENIL